MGKRIKADKMARGKEAYIRKMMKLHHCPRKVAEGWWAKCSKYALIMHQMAVKMRGGNVSAPDDESGADNGVIPFTGTHQNEDDPPDAA